MRAAPVLDEGGVTAMTDIARDRWGRPLIPPPGGGKPIPYTRASTLAKALDEGSGLAKWMCRRVAEGMAIRPDLVAMAAACRGDEKRLGEAAEAAKEAAGSSAAANTGTALHAFCQHVDEGHMRLGDIPEPHRGDVAAYRTALEGRGIIVAACERFIANDELRTAGTFDRLLALPDGRLVVADIKTSTSALRFLALQTATQVAVYATGMLYDPATGTRTPLPADTSTGVLIHLPRGGARCDLYALDLVAGAEAARLAISVRAIRGTQPAAPM